MAHDFCANEISSLISGEYTMAGYAGTKKNTLTFDLLLKLTDYAPEHYEYSNLTDFQFSKEAEKIRGFPVSESNVVTCRKGRGISNNKTRIAAIRKQEEEDLKRQKAIQPLLLIQRIEKLEAAVLYLTQQFSNKV
jgi:hypothetical protein